MKRATNKMNPELKAKWLTALRSGEYQQTQGRLYRPNPVLMSDLEPTPYPSGYCCLGVLALCAGKTVEDMSRSVNHNLMDVGMGKWDEGSVGIDPDAEDYLTDMNDKEQKSFAEIADWVEANL